MSTLHAPRARRGLAPGVLVAFASLVGLVGCASAPAAKVSASVDIEATAPETDEPSPEESTEGSSGPGEMGVTVTEGSVILGDEDATTEVLVFQDMACPHCRSMHETIGEDLREWALGGDVSVELVTVDFLSQGSSSFSTQAANLLATVAANEPGAWLAVQDALFEAQDDDLDDDGYLSLARDAGADLSDDAEEEFADQGDDGFVDAARDDAQSEGISSVPSIFVDGVQIDGMTYAEIRDALVDAVEESIEAG
ncbi:thioredoxin domain-containing protein [Sanguibacter sp. 25GB23B1]|uniref:DsbA family protein n=1 Tax=unclassified Sanguibacter TaxID=2645534 RepID=UPI0032AF4C14